VSELNAARERTDARLRYCRIHLDELKRYRGTARADGSDWECAHQESFLFHLFGVRDALLREIDRTSAFNILHICDFEAAYADLTPFLEYPGHVVSCNPRLTTGELSLRELARRFDRPIMGGMDRKGVIGTGSDEEIRRATEDVLRAAPQRFILGAECTVPGTARWEGIRTAISTAHARRAPAG